MKKFTLIVVLMMSFNSDSQAECDCCNLYLLTNNRIWDSYFPSSVIRKNNYSVLNAYFSYVDSNRITQTKPLGTFYFNRQGYVHQLDEYYRGILNHSTTFDRRFGKRIKSSTFTYLNEYGEAVDNFGETITEYSYSRKGVKTRQRSIKAEFPDDSLGSYQLVKYNSDGIGIKSFIQYHFENGTMEDYHSEYRTKMIFSEDKLSARSDDFMNDTLWTIQLFKLTESGQLKNVKTFMAEDPTEVIYESDYDYNPDGQYLSIKTVNPAGKMGTECQDFGNYNLYFTYKDSILNTVIYTYEGTEITISFSYQ